MDTRHPGFTTLQTIRPEITMNINNATICPEITRIRLVQNLISHLVDNYPRSRMLKKTPRDHYFCSCHAPRSPQLENNAKRVHYTDAHRAASALPATPTLTAPPPLTPLHRRSPRRLLSPRYTDALLRAPCRLLSPHYTDALLRPATRHRFCTRRVPE
jgi:hypothetical protein